jgi:hypothetical protein
MEPGVSFNDSYFLVPSFCIFSRNYLMNHNTNNTVIPWGRFGPVRKDLKEAAIPLSEGGTGIAKKFWEWNEEQVKPYV